LQHEPWVAEIVLVGAIENAARLGFELGELLSAQGIVPRFQQRPALSESELAAQQKPDDPSRGTVWILFPNSTTARLVFADHAHERFLIRDIPLPQGMDDVGRESVEQVIESCFLALLQGEAAISRAEMQAAMSPYVVSSTEAPQVSVAASTKPKVPPVAQPRALQSTEPKPSPAPQPAASTQSPRILTQRVGIGYGANGTGSDFGVEHGPELLAGLELIRRHDSLFAAGAFDWHFAQHHQSAEFDLSVQSSRLWLLVGWRKPLKDPTSFVAVVGPGVCLTRVTTTSLLVGMATSKPGNSYVISCARVQSGLEWGTAPLVVQLLLTADLSFYDTHFQITRDGAKEELAHEWFLRPGVTLGALWR
jgi:cell division septation protein DedD